MGKRGPTRTPTKLLIRRGSWLADGRPDKDLDLPAAKPRCPAYFSEEKYGKWAKAFWKSNLQMLTDMGLMTDLDVRCYEQVCKVFGRMKYAESKLKESDEVVFSLSRRTTVVNPWALRADKHSDHYEKLLDKFGMSPTARGSMNIEIKDSSPKTGKDKYFGKKFGNDRA